MGYKKFSKEEDEFIKANFQSMALSEIGKKYGRSGTAIAYRCKVLGLNPKRRNFFTAKEVDYILANHMTKDHRQIGKDLGRNANHIYNKMREMGVFNPAVKKFTDQEDLFIINNCSRLTFKEMAVHLKRSRATIAGRYYILREKYALQKRIIKDKEPVKSKPEPKQEKKIIKFQEPKPFVRPKAEYSNKGYEYLLNKYS